jgi:hypothetical protein
MSKLSTDLEKQTLGSIQGAALVVLAHAGEPVEMWRLAGRVAFLLVRAYPPEVADCNADKLSSFLEDAVRNLLLAGMIDTRKDGYVLGESAPDFLDRMRESMKAGVQDMERILIDSGVESMRKFFEDNPGYADRFALSEHERMSAPEGSPN